MCQISKGQQSTQLSPCTCTYWGNYISDVTVNIVRLFCDIVWVFSFNLFIWWQLTKFVVHHQDFKESISLSTWPTNRHLYKYFVRTAFMDKVNSLWPQESILLSKWPTFRKTWYEYKYILMTNVEFVTRVTRLTRVNCFRGWVKFSNIHAKNYIFSVNRRNSGQGSLWIRKVQFF